jgi:hypothetical protein
MSKLVKDLITKELRSRYGNVDSALWIEMLGVNGNATNALRRELHARHIRLEITKTLLLRRAVAGTQFAKLADALEGPAALVTGGDSLVDTAKAIEEWLPKLKEPCSRASISTRPLRFSSRECRPSATSRRGWPGSSWRRAPTWPPRFCPVARGWPAA